MWNMGTSKVITELKEFISFLQTLWGILAGVSVLFPLSNALIKIIPLGEWPDEGALKYFSPEQVTVVTMLICLFVMFHIFCKRRLLKAEWEMSQEDFKGISTEKRMQQNSVNSFFLGILALLVYLSITNLDFSYLFGWESDDPIFVFIDIFFLIFYSAFFGLVTRAFVLLGMTEYLSEQMESQ
jgi:hypothetical protein